MNLKEKKKIAARIFDVGVNRITFDKERLNEIKEAITKQDIRELFSDGAIRIKAKKGRRKIERRRRKKAGSRKKIVKKDKKEYMNKIRKLRRYLFHLKKNNKISKENYKKLRIYIKVKQIDTIKKIEEFLRGEK